MVVPRQINSSHSSEIQFQPSNEVIPKKEKNFGHRSVNSIHSLNEMTSQGAMSVDVARRVNDSSILFESLNYIKENLVKIEEYKGGLERDYQAKIEPPLSFVGKIVKFIRALFEKLGLIAPNHFSNQQIIYDLNDILKFYYDNLAKELEEQMDQLSRGVEGISNLSKNLSDSYDLSVEKGENVEILADQFIESLKQASSRNFKFFNFRDNKIACSDLDKQTLGQLYSLLKDPNEVASRTALIEYLEEKKGHSEKKIHIATPLRKVIKQLQAKQEAEIVGFYLMAEICKIKGGVRCVNLERLDLMLNHPLIKNSPLLTNGVLSNAKKVTLEAINKKNSNIVWGSKLSRNDKEKLQVKLDELANNQEVLLDFFGLKKVAEEAGVDSASFEASEDLNRELEALKAINQIELRKKI